MFGELWVRFPSGTQNFSLPHACDILIIPSLITSLLASPIITCIDFFLILTYTIDKVPSIVKGHFRVTVSLALFQKESWCTTFYTETSFSYSNSLS